MGLVGPTVPLSAAMSRPQRIPMDRAIIDANAEVDLNLAALKDIRTKQDMTVKDIFVGLDRNAPEGYGVHDALLLAAVLYDRLTRPNQS